MSDFTSPWQGYDFSGLSAALSRIQEITRPALEALQNNQSTLQPIVEALEQYKPKVEEIGQVLLHVSRRFSAIEKMGDAQFVFWDYMTEEYVDAIVDSENINKTLREQMIRERFSKVYRTIDKTLSSAVMHIHYNSAKYCSIYAIGYTDDFAKAEDQTYRKVDAMMQRDWYFSTKAFTEFKEKLQNRIRWNYSGHTEILVLQNNPGQRNVLNFHNYVAIDVNKGIREGYIDSFESFMESLIRSSKRRVTAKEAICDVRNARVSVKDILAEAINDCKKVPTPIKRIAKDRLFYRCANTIL
jgi:hypothetical protein